MNGTGRKLLWWIAGTLVAASFALGGIAVQEVLRSIEKTETALSHLSGIESRLAVIESQGADIRRRLDKSPY